jgi:hypothetical protein
MNDLFGGALQSAPPFFMPAIESSIITPIT